MLNTKCIQMNFYPGEIFEIDLLLFLKLRQSFTFPFLFSEVVVLSVFCSVPNDLATDDSSGAVVVGDTVVASNN